MKTLHIAPALAFCALGLACKQEAPPTAAKAAPAKAAPAPTKPAVPAHGPTGSLIIKQTVKDFDAWQKQFDAHADARKGMGVMWHSVSRVDGDDKVVVTHFVGTKLDAMEGFANSPGFKKAMEAAGVLGEPEVWVAADVSIKSPRGAVEGDTASMFVKHEVEDFDKWSTAFEGGAMGREKAGIVGTSVSRVKGADNTVVVHMTGKDLEGMKAYATSPRMKEAMKASGAVGEPVIWIAADVGMNRY